ncbi:hypothetical protein D554_3547 [Bordetella holmesii 30539]|uniref:N-acetyltransferase YedL n=1 Tax=Bordetella holmesii 1058 TaxID=1247648 RepID=A0ABN0RYB7_9BORD|nr:hypothetical protein D560_3653 [Bordetella holmesii ATCC 51541]AIT28266.1 hypothetical protein D558_3626 [Bordetella holmesii 44057]EWM41055.1 hypothetical protein D555_3700 [Bordetella holmesii 35009]EWM42819.1 hypothetical protein D556_3627 [Bordetella holmesii 41130]EWM44944.1 hypothetical protein D557_2933 [Bordetella holmesii 70147]EXF88270.1 hypothetical protein D554_3547 [Bordetella holmesii 30539]EXX94272.1 hypothetical protein D559_1681 [Bordetella holmesii 1058]
MVLATERIGEAEIYELDFVIGDLFENVLWACHVISIG